MGIIEDREWWYDRVVVVDHNLQPDGFILDKTNFGVHIRIDILCSQKESSVAPSLV